ncbi:hypothetical protein DXG03_001756 [Asterophora parasitica]|uniref:Putative gamma-glutamylcyclotransferase n=1 Tax=Asterophora parasitica TaxID=117018 RepID=A0A9P7KA65_9AGAR|nr:hypothetical protein DXG03_001756 [Asterophora parasitica]
MVSAFFYGTLMHPKVLQRVIKHEGADLEISPAVLLVCRSVKLPATSAELISHIGAPQDYTRHKVKRAEYPGLIPYEQGRVLVDRDLEPEERSVRGTLVTGLSERDIKLLDIFEGSEYVRKPIDVHPLSPLVKLAEYPIDEKALIPAKPPALPAREELSVPVNAETYVYHHYKRLEPELWSFEEFVQKNAWKWYGEQPPNDDVRWAEPVEV